MPDVLGEVSGFRAWRVEWCGRVPRLFSINAHGAVGIDNAMWPTDRWFEGLCPRGHTPDEIPVEACSCGLYAAKSIEQLAGLAYGSYGNWGDDDKAIGEVAFAGKVIEGTQGWRAARGRIIRLWVPLHRWELVEPLEEAYGVPVDLTNWRPFQRS